MCLILLHMAQTCLANHFLIAMPALQDPNFFHGVTYICEHSDQGAMGIVINRPLDVGLGEILEQMNIHSDDAKINAQAVYLGGPVQNERGFILHSPTGEWENMLRIGAEVAVTSSRDILEAIAHGQGPEKTLVALGYAGWGAGQLEQELLDNAWISTPAHSNIIFDLPDDQRWQAAAASAGVDLTRLSSDVGHA